MNPSTIGIIVVSATFIGSLSGMAIRKRLPDHHLEAESKDTIKQTAIEVLALDRMLARYGEETRPIRKYMLETLQQRLVVIENETTYKIDPSKSKIRSGTERIADDIRDLQPKD